MPEAALALRPHGLPAKLDDNLVRIFVLHVGLDPEIRGVLQGHRAGLVQPLAFPPNLQGKIFREQFGPICSFPSSLHAYSMATTMRRRLRDARRERWGAIDRLPLARGRKKDTAAGPIRSPGYSMDLLLKHKCPDKTIRGGTPLCARLARIGGAHRPGQGRVSKGPRLSKTCLNRSSRNSLPTFGAHA